MTKIPKPKIYKGIFEIRYKPYLKFYEFLHRAASKLDDYPDWETNGLNVILKDFTNHCSVLIHHTRIAYEQDSDNLELEQNRVKSIIDVLPYALEIPYLTRVGYRRHYLVNLDMTFESLVNVLYFKLYSGHASLKDLLPKKVSDINYRLDFEDEPYKYHLTVGPIRKNEIPSYIRFNIDNHLNPSSAQNEYQKIIHNYPDIAIFLDIDFYREDEELECKYAFEFMDIARERISNFVLGLSKYLLSIEVR